MTTDQNKTQANQSEPSVKQTDTDAALADSTQVAEKKSEAPASQAGQKRSSKASDDSRKPVPQRDGAGTPHVPARGSGRCGRGWCVAALLAGIVALAAILWWQHDRLDDVSRQVASRLQSSDVLLEQLQSQTRSATALARAQADAVAGLKRDVQGLRTEVAGFGRAWQSLSRGVDERILIDDVRRLLNMAQQQLTLVGHVNGAISILESAQSILENQPDAAVFTDLSLAIGRDLDNLRALPQVNIHALSLKLNRLVALTDNAALLMPDHIAPQPVSRARPTTEVADPQTATQADQAPAAQTEQLSWWRQWFDRTVEMGAKATHVLSQEFSGLIKIRQAQEPIALLLTDEQALLLRTSVRSMLLTAQLAMLTQESAVWEAELGTVVTMLETFYDTESIETQKALELASELRASPVRLEVGSIAQSLSALALTAQSIKLPTASGGVR